MVFNGLFCRFVYGMIFFCGLVSPVCSQITVQLDPKQRRISVIADQVRLGVVLEELFEAGMPLYYSTEYLPVDSTVSLHAVDMSWDDFIALLCEKAHLTSTVIDDHYALQYRAPDEPAGPGAVFSNSLDPGETETNHPRRLPELHPLPVNSLPGYDLRPVPVRQVSAPLSSRRTFRWRFVRLTGVYGPDFPVYHFKEGRTPDQYFEAGHPFVWGIIAGLTTPVKRLEVSSGIHYMRANFTYVYNYHFLDTEDPIPIADRTAVETAWIQVPLQADYLVARYHRFSGVMTAGLFTRYKIREKETTRYMNASERETGLFLSPVRPFSFGAILGYRIGFNVLAGWQVCISLECLQNFYRLNPQIMKLAMTEFCVQAGINYSFY